MHIHSLSVKNFRALEDIYIEFDGKINVIVGPNAAGKTTILEAVRLIKAMLTPRTLNESAQVLQSLGAASPHMPNQIRIQALARDESKAIVIRCSVNLSVDEISILRNGVDQIAISMVQAQVGQAFATPGALISFLSSPQGRQMLEASKEQVRQIIQKIESTKLCILELTITASGGATSTGDSAEAQLVSFLERRLPPYQTLFTYFPADRALPPGEHPVQLGGPDAAQQIESYNSQPATKFNRLKNTIFSASILGEISSPENTIQKQFESIFRGILKGRELLKWGVNEIGLLTVLIRDVESGRTFDLDGMSSGEKGLILTFLLIARSVAKDGIVLLDEPELHLNPAVCKDMLAFMMQEYVIPRNLQILICSHSPEILAGAFDDENCSLYHLISPVNLSKVRPQDEITIINALRRLGTGESENLLYRGIIFVEGPDDVALLEAGFSSALRRFKVKFATGRREIEKSIRELQSAGASAQLSANTFFIFDRDESPTDLRSSESVKVLQWDRRCLENYLIDLSTISSLLMDAEIIREPFNNMGDISKILRKIAFKQLDELAAKKVYQAYGFDSVGMRKEDILNQPLSKVADVMLARIQHVKDQLSQVEAATWSGEFLAKVADERSQLEAVWETTWAQDCDGKRLLEDLSKEVQLNMSIKRFKIRLMKEMALSQSEAWKTIDAQLKNLLYGDLEINGIT